MIAVARRCTRVWASGLPGRLRTLLLSAVLGGCALERGIELPELGPWERRQQLLTQLTDWDFAGRIGVSAGEEGFNGRLRWRQRGDTFDASLSGPLGAGAVRIDGDPRHIQIVERDGSTVTLPDPERDLRARYGWTIPVASLRYWVLGVPDPTSPPAGMEFSEDGQLSRLQQSGWTVTIPDYRSGGGQPMPRRIVAQNGEAKVRLVIDQWAFH